MTSSRPATGTTRRSKSFIRSLPLSCRLAPWSKSFWQTTGLSPSRDTAIDRAERIAFLMKPPVNSKRSDSSSCMKHAGPNEAGRTLWNIQLCLYQVDVLSKCHLFWHVWLPNRFTEKVVWLPELNGNHDSSVHSFIQIIGSVSSQYNETIMPKSKYDNVSKLLVSIISDNTGKLVAYLSISVSSRLTWRPPSSLDSKMDSHSSKNKMASLIFASRNMNLKFSPADIVPKEGKLISKTWITT